MSSWTSDPEIYVKRFDPEAHTNDFIIDTEAHQPAGPYELPFTLSAAEKPGEEPTAEPEGETVAAVTLAQNCVICHTDQGILQVLAVEEEEVVSEESSGEG
jgi:mono/diheme cytochrome c family protein